MYHNPYSAGYEVLMKTGFNPDSHGNAASTASYLMTNDVPDYAVMFYQTTEHEQIASIKYGQFEIGYDNLKEIREDMLGPPIEFYIPRTMVAESGAGRQDAVIPANITGKVMKELANDAANEIQQAQNQAMDIRKIEVEETLIVKKRKRTVVLASKKK